MKDIFIQSYYIYAGVVVIAALFILLFAFFYKKQIHNEIFFHWYGKKVGNWVKKYEYRINLVLRVFEIALALLMIIINTRLIIDFPNLQKENYMEISGEIIDVKYLDGRAKVMLDNDLNWYQLNTEGVKKGDNIQICCLPISKNSIVTELNGRKLIEAKEVQADE